MKVKVQGRNIELSENDDLDSFLVKVGYNFEVLPKYLYVDEDIELKDKEEIDVDNILDIAKGSRVKKAGYTFSDFLSLLGDRFLDLDNEEKVKIFLSFKEKIDDENILYFLKFDINKFPGVEDFDVEKFLKEEKKSFLNDIEVKTKEMLRMTNFEKSIKKIKGKYISDFEEEKTKYLIKTDLIDVSIFQIFDDILTNKMIPFVSLNNFYKLFREFKIPIDFVSTKYNVISGKIYNKLNYKNIDYFNDKKSFEANFDDFLIYYTGKNLMIEIEANTKNLKEKDLKERLFAIFNSLEIEIINIKKVEIKGIAYISNTSFDKFILEDLIETDNLFIYFLSMDESVKTSKSKTGVYVYFYDKLKPNYGEVVANLIPKEVEVYDLEMRNKDRKYFEIGSDYIRVKITSAKDIDSVNYFLEILSKLMTVYDEKQNEVKNFYKKYIPNFAEKEKKEKKKIDIRLKSINPDLFVSEYARQCTNQVIILEDNDKKFKGEVMTFPKSPEEGPQFNYICKDKKYPYPGLQINKLVNNDIYPYIPCCFAKDQKKDSIYLKYFEGIEKEEVEEKITRLIESNKMVNESLGTLPKNLDNLFTVFDDNYTYVRQGVGKDVNTFLNAILQVTNKLPSGKNERLAYTKNKRNELAKSDLIQVCKQECYDMTMDQIKKYLLSDNYFDPKLFIRLVEEYFNVNIFLFTRKFGENDAEMILPRHSNGYFYFNKKEERKNILIYEHLGIDSDIAKFPVCEILCAVDKSDPKQESENIFPSNFQLIKKVNESYVLLANQYFTLNIKNQAIPEIPFTVENQFIDQFGKTRAIRIKLGNKRLNLFCSPLPPLKAKLLTIGNFIEKYSNEDVKLILDKINIKDYIQIVNNKNKVIQISFNYNLVKYSIKCNNLNVDNNKEKIISNSYLDIEEESELDKFTHNKLVATLLKENFIWQYSKFLNKMNKEHTLNFLKKFVDEKTIIDPDYDYSLVEKNLKFEQDLPIYKNNKLVIDSEDTLKSLIFITRRYIQRYSESFYNYYNFVYQQNFYQDISDFDHFPEQELFYSKEDVVDYLELPQVDDNLNSKIILNYNQPYFLKVNGILFLAQEVDSLSQAISKSYNFYKNGYNSEDDLSLKSDGYTIYITNSPGNFVKSVVKGKDENNVNIILYKYEGENRYISLMKV